MSYNIWFGGTRPLKGFSGRQELIQKIVRACQPDVLALLECNGWVEDRNILHDYESNLGMRSILLATKPDHENNAFNIVLMIKKGLVIKNVVTDAVRFWHGVVAVEVTGSDNVPVQFIATHLSPLSPDKRLEEAKIILKDFCNQKRCVLMGDLNSLGPQDKYAVTDIPEGYRSRHLTDGKIDTRVLEAFDQAGFVDSMACLHPEDPGFTAPTKLASDPAFEGANLRLDYILVSSALKNALRSGEVIRNEESNKASDHFPLVVELDV
jgi:exodeoxyribonuclease-3